MLLEGNYLLNRAFNATTPIRAGRFVALGANQNVAQVSVDGAEKFGVALEDFNPTAQAPYIWANRQGVTVELLGIARITVAEAVLPGDKVISDAAGKARKFVAADATAGRTPAGTILTPAGVGEFADILLRS